MLEPKVGRVVRDTVPFLPKSGHPGPSSEVMVKDQFGGRMRRGEGEGEGSARSVVVRPARARAVVVYFIVSGALRLLYDRIAVSVICWISSCSERLITSLYVRVDVCTVFSRLTQYTEISHAMCASFL